MAKIYIDAGHGGDSIGAVYKNRKEQDDCLKLALAVGKLVQAQGVTVKYSRTTDVNPDLNNRCYEANEWGADYFISIHRNAYKTEAAQGVEAYIYSKAKAGGPEYTKAKKIVDLVCTSCGFKNRGVKFGAPSYTDFAVNRITTMYSCLLECGFIDSTADNKIFDDKFNVMARAIAEGLCDAVGVTYKDTPTTTPNTGSTTGKLWRVQVGSYSIKANAEKMVKKLKDAGFTGVIVEGK